MIIYHIIGICDETYNIFYLLYIFNGLLLVDTFSLGFKGLKVQDLINVCTENSVNLNYTLFAEK